MKLLLARRLALATLFVASNAMAGVITIEPDDYAAGTYIAPTESASVAFIHHQAGEGGFSYHAAFSVTEPTCALYADCFAPTGDRVMTDGTVINGKLSPMYTLELGNMRYGFAGEYPDNYYGVTLTPERIALMRTFDAVRVDFNVLTDYVSFDMYGPTDPAEIWAFGANDELLSVSSYGERLPQQQFKSDPSCGNGCYTWVQTGSVQHEVADIKYVILGSHSSGGYIDAIRFSVPEPSELALFAAALGCLLLFRRRSI